MKVMQSLGHLTGHGTHDVFWQTGGPGQQGGHTAHVHVLQHNVHHALGGLGAITLNDVLALTGLEGFDFAVHLTGEGDLFHGQGVFLVLEQVDDAFRALA